MKNFILIISILLFSNTFGQQLLSFNDCLELAIKNNLSLKSAAVSEEIASYQHKASYGKLLPSIYGNAENKNTWGREINPVTNLYVSEDIKNFKGNIEANFNLFSGFSTWNSIKLAKQEVEINKANIQRVKNEITIDLAQKFITILYLQEIIIANQEQIKISDKQLELADLKFNSGVIAESEVFKIKSQKVSEELTLLNNQSFLNDNLISLKQLMNIPLETEIQLLKPNLELNKNLGLDENPFSLTNKAIEIHPSYQMSLLSEKKGRTALAIARASRYPTLDMRLTYGSNFTLDEPLTPIEDQINTNLSTGLRFTLTIPIFNQFENFLEVRTSKLLYKQSKLDTQIVKNQLSQEVLKAIMDTKTSMKKNESSEIGYEFSRKSYDADVLKFELGKININELNTTKMIYNNTQAELIRAKYELLFNNALINFYLGENFSL